MSTSKEEAQQRLERIRRLRKLGLQRGAKDLARPPAPNLAPEAGLLPGEAVETPFGPAWVRTARYPLIDRPDLATWLRAEPAALAALGRDPLLADLAPAQAAFIDTETTGLSLDTGTYTFMIGIGTYELGAASPSAGNDAETDAFVVRQFFMRHPGEERAQLHLVEEALSACTGIVSFNGRSFDMPLVQNRFILARIPPPLPAAPHLDLLPPARRFWRGRLDSCRLGSLEQHVLGIDRTEEDVPGWMIPDIYRDYYRTGIATDMLARVFYHNLVDITTMPLLAARMVQFFSWPVPVERLGDLHPAECANLARAYEALAWFEAGEAAYRATLAGPLDNLDRARVLRDLSLLLKRQARRDEAAALWEAWISTIPGDDLTPYIELAKYHEWQTGDLAAARGWAAWALRIAEGWPAGPMREETLVELRHRLERLERKMGGE
ncbi:MAG: hypothetical protein CVU38_12275 [Chloroflexi bacterium HGW-Chloroflexi-1]|nr:MAG: hypothetical protein CVU38_12275 [Chloroflexi bacterium HGW-Chloroflexi-1]